MSDKRVKILSAAEVLFETKGFKSTSMQEIANEAGISKGAVYLHFKSKDELLIAVCESHTNHITSRVKAILNDKSLNKHEKLAAQIHFQFLEMRSYQNFYQSLLNDEALKINQDFIVYYLEYKIEWQQLQEAFLLSIYGDSVTPWIIDLALCLDGLVSSYLALTLFEEVNPDIDALVPWVVRCIDKIAKDLTHEQPKHVLSTEMLSSREKLNCKKAELKTKNIQEAFKRLLDKSDELKLSPDARETLDATIEHLKAQLSNENYDKALLRALLAGLRTYRGLSKERLLLAQRLEIELV